MAYFVYILKCSDGSLYTGYTLNLQKRLELHNAGKASRYTRGKLPVECVYWEEHQDKSSAMRREMEIKGWPRVRKLELAHSKSKLGCLTT